MCYSGEPFVFRLLAVLAAFGWIFELLVAEERLFTGAPHEIFGAVDAQYGRVLKIVVRRGNDLGYA